MRWCLSLLLCVSAGLLPLVARAEKDETDSPVVSVGVARPEKNDSQSVSGTVSVGINRSEKEADQSLSAITSVAVERPEDPSEVWSLPVYVGVGRYLQVLGPPYIANIAISPSGPYQPGATVSVAALIYSAKPLSSVTAQLDGSPVSINLSEGLWKASVPLPSSSSQSVLTITATDEAGRSDTRSRSLSFMQAGPPPETPTDWVVLVHGLQGYHPGSYVADWNDFHPFLDQEYSRYLGANGFSGKPKIYRVDNMDSLHSDEENADQLAAYIKSLDIKSNDRIFLVGHSNGGFISRIYLSKYRDKPGYHVNQVFRLVQAGTANLGTPFASLSNGLIDLAIDKRPVLKIAYKLAKNLLFPVLDDMTLSGADKLDRRFPYTNQDPPISMVAGDCQDISGCSELYYQIPYEVIKYLPYGGSNDGIVPVSSAKGLPRLGKESYYDLFRTDHGQLVKSDKAKNTLLAAMFGQPASPLATNQIRLLETKPESRLLTSVSDTIAAGDTLTIPLSLGNEQQVTVSATFFGSGAEATLNSPGGVITPTQQDAYTASWEISNPAPGDWNLAVQSLGMDEKPTVAMVLVTSVTASPFTVEVSPALATAGQPVTLIAHLETGSYQTDKTTVIGNIHQIAETSIVTPVSLHDDGVAPDETAGDGSFSGQFQPVAPGRYAVEFIADGTDANNVPLHRANASSFAVLNPPGDVNGDNAINIQDVTLLLQMYLDLVDPTPEQFLAGDVRPRPGTDGRTYGDGKLLGDDLNWVLRRVVGLETAP